MSKPPALTHKEGIKKSKRISARARRSDLELKLKSIYGADAENLHRFERRRQNRTAYFVFGSLFFILLGAALWFVAPSLAWRFSNRESGAGFSLDLAGPDHIAIGGEQTYQIQWANTEDRPFQSASIRLTFPPDFSITSAVPPPTDRKNMQWNFGMLPAGTKGVIEIKGIFSGALGAESALQLIGTYRPERTEKNAESLATLPVSYTDSVLGGFLQAPAKVLAGDAVSVSYTVINHGKEPMKGLVAAFTLPDGFVPSAKQAADDHQLSLPIGDLVPAASTTITLVGSFASGVSGDSLFHVEAGRRALGGLFFPAQKSDVRVPVLAGNFSLASVANGSNSDQSLQPGGIIHFALNYQNTSQEDLKDIRLTVGLESLLDGISATGTSLIDWPLIQSPAFSASSTHARIQTITFEKKRVSDFGLLPPGAEGTLEFSFPTKALPKGIKDGVIRITVDGEIGSAGNAKISRSVHTVPISLRYRTDADLDVFARYFTEEGAPLGFGPLPPVAQKTTAYRIFWHLTKTLHPLQDFSVAAHLPPNAVWSARAEADLGTIRYDPETRLVQWTADQISDHANELEASFEIQLTPDANDIGRFADLLDETTIQMKDAVTSETISRNKPALSTDLANDDGARGKGVVRKE
ncbi:MAG TPA: hypothetical protein VFQ60_01640 [Patescibacteria group bacterium]|nr:hypothetical protein [Patescibacteria group bacterium]